MKHILIIRLSAMGDVAISVPVIRALIQQNESVKITFLTRSFFIPFFEDFENVSVFSPDLKGKHKGFFGILKLFKELSHLKIDAIADLHNVIRSKLLVQFFRFSGTPFVQLDKGRGEKRKLTKPRIDKILIPLPSMHERYADVFRKMGFNIDLSKVNFPKKKPLPIEISDKFHTKNLVGFAPFATYESKSFPEKKIEELVFEISKLPNTTIFLFGGGEKEKSILESIASKYKNVFSLVKKMSFDDELKIISNLNAMISMDSGNGHIAAMYGVSVFTIWGVTHPFLGFTPFHQPLKNQVIPDLKKFPLIPTSVYGNKFPKEYLACFETISVNRIKDLLEDSLL